MSDHGLSPQQIEVISALSNGDTITAAAEQAGIHRNTIANWRRNQLPFQHALSDAQYDRAILFRERTEALVELAVKTLQEILANPNTPASVRLKAALAVIQTASTPPEPKRQIMLNIETVQVAQPAETPVHPSTRNDAQPIPPSAPQNTHKPAQAIERPQPPRQASKIGRNEACPCGSSLKFKRCCLNKPAQSPLPNAATLPKAA